MAYDPVCRYLVFSISSLVRATAERTVASSKYQSRLVSAWLPFVSDTQLDSDTVGVAALRMLVGFRAAVPGNVLVLHRLPNLSVKPTK